MPDTQNQSLRRHLLELLDGGSAHAKFEDVVPGIPARITGRIGTGIHASRSTSDTTARAENTNESYASDYHDSIVSCDRSWKGGAQNVHEPFGAGVGHARIGEDGREPRVAYHSIRGYSGKASERDH